VLDGGIRERRLGVLHRAFGAIADVLMPPLCLACHRRLAAHDALCPSCWRDIDVIRSPLCDRLGLPMPYDTGAPMMSAAAAADPPAYDRARAVARIEGVMRMLIHDLKFHDRHDARRLFGRWLAEASAELLADADLLVPLTRRRLLSRRLNQSALLAHGVARPSRIGVEPLALLRVRPTKPQVGLSRQRRRDNVANAFAVAPGRKDAVTGKKIVVADDVITTGATAEACARALKRAGAARVDVLALAMVTDATVVSA
jgi:ComF family protein